VLFSLVDTADWHRTVTDLRTEVYPIPAGLRPFAALNAIFAKLSHAPERMRSATDAPAYVFGPGRLA
jgi:hypothetical protein